MPEDAGGGYVGGWLFVLGEGNGLSKVGWLPYERGCLGVLHRRSTFQDIQNPLTSSVAPLRTDDEPNVQSRNATFQSLTKIITVSDAEALQV